MVAEVIRQVPDESRQTYGARRVHAELVLGCKITVARCTVELVMRRLRLAGLPGRPRYRKNTNAQTASDLVNRGLRADGAEPAVADRHHRAPNT
jgi:putative transposase